MNTTTALKEIQEVLARIEAIVPQVTNTNAESAVWRDRTDAKKLITVIKQHGVTQETKAELDYFLRHY